jgi:hypothetical protein
MKTLKCFFLLLAFIGLLFIGCSEKSQPIAPSDQVATQQALDKVNITYFTGTDEPTPYIISFGEVINNGKRVVGKGLDGWDYLDATDPRVTGMVHIIGNSSFDENGEGPVHGTGILIPTTQIEDPTELATDVIWEINWNGFSKDGIGYFKMTGVGKGGNIQGMKLFITEEYNQTTYTGQVEGYIQSH